MQRRDLPRSTTYSPRDVSPRATTGAYNSGRGVPPPRTRTHSFGRIDSERRPGHIDTSQPPPMTAAGPRGAKSARTDPFLLRVVAMVDEATEPGVSAEESERIRKELIEIVGDRGLEKMVTSAISGGQAVEYAIRKRLKSESEEAVMNTIDLLEELMSTCPYFYRYIATEKFFRRLWRFVFPDYKNSISSMIPIFGKQKMPGVRSDTVPQRVLILIRAWAEELSVMFEGRYDQHAGFLIERYNSKRHHVKFPNVPSRDEPWVCRVSVGSPDYLRGSSSRRGGRDERKEVISLEAAENTVNLFANLIDNASSMSDLKDELCSELAGRCLDIQQNLTRLSMSMSKEDELTRAIAVSEKLERTLGDYKASLESGRVTRGGGNTDRISLQSEDEGYDELDRRISSRSSDRYSGLEGRGRGHYSESSEVSSGAREDWREKEMEREGDRERGYERDRERRDERENERERRLERERGHERERAHDRDRAHDRERGYERERGLERDRDRRNDRDSHDMERLDRSRHRDERGSDEERDMRRERSRGQGEIRYREERGRDGRSKEGSASHEDRDVRGKRQEKKKRDVVVKPAIRRRQKSDSDLPSVSHKKKTYAASAVKKDGLIEIPDDSDSDEVEETKEAFSMLAERYASQSSSRKPTRPAAKPKAQKPPTRQYASDRGAPSSTTSTPSVPNAAQMYATNTPMPFNPMMMVANPYAMYGSISHIPMADPMSMYGAYQTVNPAMYYQSMNPGMMPALGMQPPQPQRTPGQSPLVQPTAGQIPMQNLSISDGTGADRSDGSQNAAQVPPPQVDAQSSAMVPAAAPAAAVAPMPAGAPIPAAAPMPGAAPVPTAASMGSFYASVPGGMPMMSDATQMGNEAQAAMYQSAMQQAATAYHVAANAYRSVSGQAPVAQNAPMLQGGVQNGAVAHNGAVGQNGEGEQGRE